MPADPAAVVRALAGFDAVAGPVVLARRRRTWAHTGVLRLLVPRAVLRIDTRTTPVRVAARPDALAWFMVLICTGGVVVELAMERSRYPRDYPPAFVYGLALVYVVALVLELQTSRTAGLRALVLEHPDVR